MRQRERIPIYLDKLTPGLVNDIFKLWFKDDAIPLLEESGRICKEKRKIKKYWIANHDLRFSQVLVNMGYIPNIPGFWYYMEDDETFIKAGCDPREILLWGQNYDQDMKRLPETNWIVIKDMTIDHIRAVISFMGDRLPEKYKNVFIAELAHRGLK